MRKLYRYLPALSILLIPLAASAAAPKTFSDLSSQLVNILNIGAGLLIILGIVIYFYGVSTNIFSSGDEARQKLRSYLTWGIFVIFLMVSIWGILRLLQSTLFSRDPTPTGSSGQSAPPANTFSAPTFQE